MMASIMAILVGGRKTCPPKITKRDWLLRTGCLAVSDYLSDDDSSGSEFQGEGSESEDVQDGNLDVEDGLESLIAGTSLEEVLIVVLCYAHNAVLHSQCTAALTHNALLHSLTMQCCTHSQCTAALTHNALLHSLTMHCCTHSQCTAACTAALTHNAVLHSQCMQHCIVSAAEDQVHMIFLASACIFINCAVSSLGAMLSMHIDAQTHSGVCSHNALI